MEFRLGGRGTYSSSVHSSPQQQSACADELAELRRYVRRFKVMNAKRARETQEARMEARRLREILNGMYVAHGGIYAIYTTDAHMTQHFVSADPCIELDSQTLEPLDLNALDLSAYQVRADKKQQAPRTELDENGESDDAADLQNSQAYNTYFELQVLSNAGSPVVPETLAGYYHITEIGAFYDDGEQRIQRLLTDVRAYTARVHNVIAQQKQRIIELQKQLEETRVPATTPALNMEFTQYFQAHEYSVASAVRYYYEAAASLPLKDLETYLKPTTAKLKSARPRRISNEKLHAIARYMQDLAITLIMNGVLGSQ